MPNERRRRRSGGRRQTVRVLSAGVAVVRHDGSQWRLLLLRAYQYWDFPKGRVEPGESPMQGARREVAEETGITELEFRWGDVCVETGPYAQGKLARYYVAETRERRVVMGISPELGRPEHQEYRWVDFDEAFEITSPRVRRVLQWLREVIAPADPPRP